MIHIVIVADIPLYSEGLARLLGSADGIDVVATARNGEEALEKVSTFSPGFLLIDAAMPDGLEVISRIRLSDQVIKIVALTVGDIEQNIITCAEAGIDGYVTRDATIRELIEVVRAADAGELQCSPRAAALLLKRVSLCAALRSPLGTLTSREAKVLELVEQGMSNKQVSETLGIELATVKNHVHSILEKLHVRRRGEAAALFRRQQGAATAAPRM